MYAPPMVRKTIAMIAVVVAIDSDCGPAKVAHFQFSMLGMDTHGVVKTFE